MTKIRFTKDLGLAENLSRIHTHYQPLIEEERTEAERHLQTAHTLEAERKQNLQEIVGEALTESAEKLRNRSERLKQANPEDYFEAIEIKRWYEEVYTKSKGEDPPKVKENIKTSYKEQLKKLEEIDKEIVSPLPLDIVLYEKDNRYKVGIPLFTTHELDGEQSLTNQVCALIVKGLRKVGEFEKEANQGVIILYTEKEVKPRKIYDALTEIANSSEMRRLNITLNVYDATAPLESKLETSEQLEERLKYPIVRPETNLSIKEVANILKLTEGGVRQGKYKEMLVENPDYRGHRGRLEGIPKYFFPGKNLHKLVHEFPNLRAKCRFEGFGEDK